MCAPEGLSAQIPRCARRSGQSCHRRTGNLQLDQGGGRKNSTNGYQHPSGAYVQSCREFEKLFTLFVASPNEDPNRQRQPGPLSSFAFSSALHGDGVSILEPFVPMEEHLRVQISSKT